MPYSANQGEPSLSPAPKIPEFGKVVSSSLTPHNPAFKINKNMFLCFSILQMVYILRIRGMMGRGAVGKADAGTRPNIIRK
jgi:hypothetical protein